MDFSDLVRKRQSDRRYEERAVPRELIMRCIEARRLDAARERLARHGPLLIASVALAFAYKF